VEETEDGFEVGGALPVLAVLNCWGAIGGFFFDAPEGGMRRGGGGGWAAMLVVLEGRREVMGGSGVWDRDVVCSHYGSTFGEDWRVWVGVNGDAGVVEFGGVESCAEGAGMVRELLDKDA